MTRIHSIVPAALAALLLLPLSSAQEGAVEQFRRSAVNTPEPTDAGSWDGTWYYISRDQKMALWIRTTDGKPELQLQYFGFAMAENFVTDWNCHAEYEVKNLYPGRFDMHITERDENSIKGSLDWVLTIGDTTRSEKGDFIMYRAGVGRSIVIKFDNYARTESMGTERKSWRPQQAWTFRKASKRLVLWEELPF